MCHHFNRKSEDGKFFFFYTNNRTGKNKNDCSESGAESVLIRLVKGFP